MPYYAVARGNKIGVYTNWDTAKSNVLNVSNSCYKKFNTASEAQAFVNNNSSGSGSSYNSGGSSYSPASSQSSSSYGGYSGGARQSNASSSKPKTSSSTPASSGKIYVDGAARGNGKDKYVSGGYGVYYGPGHAKNAAVAMDTVDAAKTTNQRAELFALKHALNDIANDDSSNTKYSIHSDSKYAINSVSEWSKGWTENNWNNSKGQPVANRDIIESCLPLVEKVNAKYSEKGWGPVEFHHVKGHAGEAGNEAADRLANIGADEMSSRNR